ncbi:hypothetical protein GGQ80_002835 [Sphingomonas jinjuensis]|uniref:DUF2178 domain-containing protein n=1 Tax=Sphingomonas jinjuensis TaxID=535907 RepID=A0A840FB84_9SPHN|nr:hypothetical protein [Sphingomonas jinjuensis]MBB4154919.1 hypothetical protein [Sphingomonas jinjuensis]
MQNTIDQAEAFSRKWAMMLFVLAGAVLAAELAGVALRTDFVDGFWLGVALVCACTLVPWRRLLRLKGPLHRLLDDEVVRDHRRTSCVAGFWCSLVVALALAPLAHDGGLSAYDIARLVATAALFSAMVTFATLELRAAR